MVEAALGDRGAQSRALGVISLLGQLASRAHLTLHRVAFGLIWDLRRSVRLSLILASD